MVTSQQTRLVWSLSLCLILSIGYFPGCKKQKSAWQGTIEEVDGITIVKNPKEPLYTADVFVLEEELSITDEAGGEECIFARLRAIEVDESGRIYILDYDEAHVYIFDSEGNYLKTIGKKGQGPGELNMPFSLKITNEKELAVESFRRGINFYSLEGDFLRELPTAKVGAVRINIDSKANVLATVIVRDENDPRYEVIKFDPDLNKLHSLGSSPLPSARSEGFNPFGGTIMYATRSDDHVICGTPQLYELSVYNPQGDIVMKISKEYDAVAVTKEEKEEVMKGMPEGIKVSIPKFHNPFRWIILDDGNRIFVMTYEKAGEDNGFYYDVFGADGKCLVKVPLKNTPYLIKKNKLYTVDSDEEGFSVVKRYHMDWRI